MGGLSQVIILVRGTFYQNKVVKAQGAQCKPSRVCHGHLLHLKEKGRDVGFNFNNENQEVKNNTLNKEIFNLKSQGIKNIVVYTSINALTDTEHALFPRFKENRNFVC